jgi:paraquat-inducible protein A
MAYPSFNLSKLMSCPDCDLLLKEASPAAGHKIKCPRCGTTIRSSINDSITKALATSLTGLLLYIPAMNEPIMTFCIAGMKGSGNVINAFFSLVEKGYYFVGGMVLLTSILFPLLKLFFLFLVSFSLKFNRFKTHLPGWFRTYKHLCEWGMVEVYMLGILITIIKMKGMAEIEYNIGFLCFFLLVFITTTSSVVVDEEAFWKKMESAPLPDVKDREDSKMDPLPLTARSAGIVRCMDCSKLVYEQLVSNRETAFCPRCHAALNMRKPDSLSRTWALVLSALVFLFPANILPIMRVDYMGTPDDSTILDGIIYFFKSGEYGIGAIILTASVLVPLFKVVGILILLLSIQFKRKRWLENKTTMFHFIEFIGRWSFLDIFVIALMGAMVHFGSLTTILAAPAARFFTAVVVSTMLAAIAFDPRILWDTCTDPTPNLNKEKS